MLGKAQEHTRIKYKSYWSKCTESDLNSRGIAPLMSWCCTLRLASSSVTLFRSLSTPRWSRGWGVSYFVLESNYFFYILVIGKKIPEIPILIWLIETDLTYQFFLERKRLLMFSPDWRWILFCYCIIHYDTCGNLPKQNSAFFQFKMFCKDVE